MYFSDRVVLYDASRTVSGNGYGVPGPAGEGRRVWADRRSVARSEFYKAMAAGVETSAAFRLHARDYWGEPYLAHRGALFRVVRAYQTDRETVELTCSISTLVTSSHDTPSL